MAIYGRTDLADESYRFCTENNANISALKGVSARRRSFRGVDISSVEIINEEGSRALGKPKGKYFTMTLSQRFERGSELFPVAAQTLSLLIKSCILNRPCGRILIAALGNPDITPDAVGSICASNIIVTKHLKEKLPQDFSSFSSVMLCRTGVLGTSGIESARQIKCLCTDLRPDLVIAVDALAGSDISRLCSCVQISDSGIAPGSGVGNSREELSENYLGCPVVAVGVPTVIDAAHFSALPELRAMFVTSRDVDSGVRSCGRLIGYGINLALHPGLTVADIDMLLG